MHKRREKDYFLPKYRKAEIKKKVKENLRNNPPDDLRKLRRNARTNHRNGELDWCSFDKIGKIISRIFTCNNTYKSKYSHERREAEYYDALRYADY